MLHTFPGRDSPGIILRGILKLHGIYSNILLYPRDTVTKYFTKIVKRKVISGEKFALNLSKLQFTFR